MGAELCFPSEFDSCSIRGWIFLSPPRYNKSKRSPFYFASSIGAHHESQRKFTDSRNTRGSRDGAGRLTVDRGDHRQADRAAGQTHGRSHRRRAVELGIAGHGPDSVAHSGDLCRSVSSFALAARGGPCRRRIVLHEAPGRAQSRGGTCRRPARFARQARSLHLARLSRSGPQGHAQCRQCRQLSRTDER